MQITNLNIESKRNHCQSYINVNSFNNLIIKKPITHHNLIFKQIFSMYIIMFCYNKYILSYILVMQVGMENHPFSLNIYMSTAQQVHFILIIFRKTLYAVFDDLKIIIMMNLPIMFNLWYGPWWYGPMPVYTVHRNKPESSHWALVTVKETVLVPSYLWLSKRWLKSSFVQK